MAASPASQKFSGPSAKTNSSYEKSPSVLFVGSTGAGKSTLCNFLHDLGDGKREFIAAQPGCHSSVTQNTSHLQIQVVNSIHKNGAKYNFIDTPGLNESTKQDLVHMKELYQNILTIGEINALVLVIPYNFKLDIQWVQTVSFFRDAFLPLFARGHACIALTHMSEEDYLNLQDSEEGFEETKNKVLADCNEKLDLKARNCEITALFCLNASFPKKFLAKAKTVLQNPSKLKDTWISRCLLVRENMLTYFAAMDAISFKLSSFPLPPAYDALRLKAIENLEIRDKELTKTLKATKSCIEEEAQQLSLFNSNRENYTVKLRAVEEDLEKKQCVQQAKPEFRSGDRALTGGTFSAKPVSVSSPSADSWLNWTLHNCEIKPEPEVKKILGNSVQVSVVPDWFAFQEKASDNGVKKWNWFAQIWLEFDGEKHYAQDINLLKEMRTSLNAQIAQVDSAKVNLDSRMRENGEESATIDRTLNDIHRLRDFLKRATFPLAEFELLVQAYPMDDFAQLASILFDKPPAEEKLLKGLKHQKAYQAGGSLVKLHDLEENRDFVCDGLHQSVSNTLS